MQLGRLLTRDPLEYEGSEWNLYEYVYSNPLRYVDPSGAVGLPTDVDSVSQSIWRYIRMGKWDTALDIIDDMLCGVKDPCLRQRLKGLKGALKQIKGLTKWRKQASKLGQKVLKRRIKKLVKTLATHLKKRGDCDTAETMRIRYMIDFMKKLLK